MACNDISIVITFPAIYENKIKKTEKII